MLSSHVVLPIVISNITMGCKIRSLGDWHTAFVPFRWTCLIPPQGDTACMTHMICLCGALLTYLKRRADTSSCASAVWGCVRAHPPCARSQWVRPELMFVLCGGGGDSRMDVGYLYCVCLSLAHRFHIQPQHCGKHRHANAGMSQRGNGGDIFP